VQVAELTVGVDQLTEQKRPPVAEERDERAELVSGVRLRHRRGVGRHAGAGQQAHAVGGSQQARVQAQLGGQRLVEHQEPRIRRLLGLPGDGHLRQVAREAVVQDHGG
jgi:hypothetical protein